MLGRRLRAQHDGDRPRSGLCFSRGRGPYDIDDENDAITWTTEESEGLLSVYVVDPGASLKKNNWASVHPLFKVNTDHVR